MISPYIEFLLARQKLNEETAERIEHWANQNQEPVGMIAVDHGLILGRQIDEVLEKQRDCPKRFGEIAIDLGYLTSDRVERLLEIQRYRIISKVTEALALSGRIPLQKGVSLIAEYASQHPEECFADCAASKA